MSKLINIALISNIFIFYSYGMKNDQNYQLTNKPNTNIDNLCPDLFKEIIAYLVPKNFPDNKKDFKENYYKNIANLKLVNKNLKFLINKSKIIDKFEDHLLNKIKLLNSHEIRYAAELGSKKYFLNNTIKTISEKEDINFTYHLKESLFDAIEKKNSDIISILLNKFIIPNLKIFIEEYITQMQDRLEKYDSQEFKNALKRGQQKLLIKRIILISLTPLIEYLSFEIFRIIKINPIYYTPLSLLSAANIFFLNKADKNIFIKKANNDLKYLIINGISYILLHCILQYRFDYK